MSNTIKNILRTKRNVENNKKMKKYTNNKKSKLKIKYILLRFKTSQQLHKSSTVSYNVSVWSLMSRDITGAVGNTK